MRILRFLAMAVFVAALLALVVGLIARELLLIWGVATVRGEMNSLKQIAARPTQYASQCLQKGAQANEDLQLIERYQLRFVSDTEFVTEVICHQFRLDPIRVDDGQLPLFVRKVPGSSGLIWGDDSSAVELDVFGRRRTILVENKDIFYEGSGLVELGEGPDSICKGYGFSCCSEATQLGTGDQLTGVSDCPRSCYAQCQPRPIVLSFSSDPFMDPQTRIAETQAGQPVTFSYVTDPATAEQPQITILFGDGSQEVLTEPNGSVQHTYSCRQVSCTYTAQLQITDERGRTSADIPVTKITLQVRP